MLILSITGPPVTAQQDFACTEVLGVAQAWQWFTGKSMSEAGADTLIPANAFLDHWQARFTFGAALERWKSRDFTGWKGTYRSVEMCARDQVDRVVFAISGAEREPMQWLYDMVPVIDLIHTKYPHVKLIVLQPAVGAQDGECTDIRAARIHPQIIRAIQFLLTENPYPDITPGALITVSGCEQYADDPGHLTAAGAGYAHDRLRAYFSR